MFKVSSDISQSVSQNTFDYVIFIDTYNIIIHYVIDTSTLIKNNVIYSLLLTTYILMHVVYLFSTNFIFEYILIMSVLIILKTRQNTNLFGLWKYIYRCIIIFLM